MTDSTTAPRALVVEDIDIHARLARQLLTQVGFDEVVVKPRLLEGIEKAKRLLDTRRPPRPTLILLDWHLPDPEAPSLQANVAAAELARAMDVGEIHPAHIVVLTFNPTREVADDAADVGCDLVLAKPLEGMTAERLRALVDTPVPPLREAQRRGYTRLLRYTAPTLELLYRGRMSASGASWDAHAVKWLLMKAVTSQDLPEPGLTAWVEQHGGLDSVRAALLREPIPDADLAQLRDLLLRDPGERQDWYAAMLGRSIAGYHALKAQLFEVVADRLNSEGFGEG